MLCSSLGSEFHNVGAATANTLSPSVLLDLMAGKASSRLFVELRLCVEYLT